MNVCEEGTALISTCEVSDILTPSAPGIQDQGCSHARLINRSKRKWLFRRKVLLILAWSLIVNFSQSVNYSTKFFIILWQRNCFSMIGAL